MKNQIRLLKTFSLLCLIVISLKISAQGIQVEAETGALTGSNTKVENTASGFSGSGYVTGFIESTDGAMVTFSLESAGKYSLSLGFSAPYGAKDNFIDINGVRSDTVHFPEISGFSEVLAGDFSFVAGENTVKFSSYWGWCLLDYFKISDIAPRGDFSISPEVVATGDTITFDASGTYDPNGTIESYNWDFGDGQTADSMVVKHIFTQEGKKNISLTVTDNDGNSTKIVKQIDVARTEPYAIFSIADEYPEPLVPVTFNGTLSYDLTGSVDSWEWDFGDGNTSSVSSPVHTYNSPGNYKVSLTVTNNRGKTATRSNFIFVYADTVVLRGPASITKKPATYHKAELAFQVKADYTNPYDPEQVRVDAVITSPGGADSIVMPCFYYVGSYFQQGKWHTDTTLKEWRLRFLPEKPGDYAVKLKYYGIKTEVAPELTISVVDSSSKGIIRADEKNNQHYRHETGEPYYPLGINIGWNDIETYSAILHNIASYHGNFFRYWHTPFAQQALEWSDNGFYEGLGKYNQVAAGMTDSLLNLGNELGVYMQLVIFQHGMFSENVNPMWGDNPYNVNNGGFVEHAEEYFYNDDCKKYAKKLLRYIVARWSYSPNIFAWEFFNEVQFTGINPDQTSKWFPGVLSWHSEMSLYVESIDPNDHLMTTSADDSQLIQLDTVKKLDILQYHLYSTDLLKQQKDRDYMFTDTLSRAIINGEYGEDVSTANVPAEKQEISLWNAIMTRVPHIMWLWDNYYKPEWGKVFYYPWEFMKDDDFTRYENMSPRTLSSTFSGGALGSTCLAADSAMFGVVYHTDANVEISDAFLQDVALPYGYYDITCYLASTDQVIEMKNEPLIRKSNSISLPDFKNSIAFKIKYSADYLYPIALAGPDIHSPMGLTIQLDGSESYDPGGGALSFNWTLYDKPASSKLVINNPTDSIIKFEPDVSGYYYFKLEVSNGTSDAVPDTVVVTASSKPVAVAGEDGTVAPMGYFGLDGTASYDPDGDDITYQWDIVKKPESSKPALYNGTKSIAQFRSSELGLYGITLTVSDGLQMSNPDTVFVTVTEKTNLENPDEEKIMVYPNPAKGQIFIHLTGNTLDYAEVQVFDIYGRLVKHENLNRQANVKPENQVVMDVSSIPPGWYLLEIKSGNKTCFQKFMKE